MNHDPHAIASAEQHPTVVSLMTAPRLVGGLLALGTVALAAMFGLVSLPASSGIAIADSSTHSIVRVSNEVRPVGFVAVADMATKAVVNISPSSPTPAASTDNLPEGARRFFGFPHIPHHEEQPSHRSGSGVVVSPDGYILTNNHVIEGASEVVVTFSDRREAVGKVIGNDPKSDLAVIHVDVDDLPFLQWGSSAELRVGEPVLAVGAPFGLSSSVTQGIVSGLGRGGMGITRYEDFIQTDAAINPGNSGGALINADGELIGINTAILSRTGGNHGVGFAISSDMAKRVYHDLVDTGTVRRGYLGVGIQELTAELAKAFKRESKDGVLVTSVEAGSPAEHAGLIRGDIITEFGGEVVETPQTLQRVVTRASVGSATTLIVIREGKAVTFDVRLQEHPDTRRVADSQAGTYDNVLASVKVQPVDQAMAHRLGLNADVSGVVVISHIGDAQSSRTPLMRGDVIIEVNGASIASIRDYERAVTTLSSDGDVLLYIWRNRVPMFMTITT